MGDVQDALSATRIVSGKEYDVVRIPYRGKPKPRPRADRNVHNPSAYTAWKQDIVNWLTSYGFHRLKIDEPVKLIVIFEENHMDVQLVKLGNVKRPKHVRADIDNLMGGLMDALQDADVITDDRLVLAVEAKAWSPEQ